MPTSTLRRNRRGGVLLDAVVAIALLLIGAWVLSGLGVSLHEVLHGAARFLGLG